MQASWKHHSGHATIESPHLSSFFFYLTLFIPEHSSLSSSPQVVFYHGSSRAAIRQQLQQHAQTKQMLGEGDDDNAPFDVLLTCYTLFERDRYSRNHTPPRA